MTKRQNPIYLDHNATTPVDARVLEAMLPYFSERFGNAASKTHPYGWEAKAAVDRARAQIAAAIGTEDPTTLIFTSGATESNNLAIKGVTAASAIEHPHILTQKTEHKCVLDSCKTLEKQGVRTTYLNVDATGRVDPDDVYRALTDETILVCMMMANNEIGTIQPIREIAQIVHARPGTLFHCDAAQALGKIPIDVEADDIDLLSLSAHKAYGPKGIGALYIGKRRPPIRLEPMLHGGGHERGLRSGTLPVPLIVGFGEAAKIAVELLPSETARMKVLRTRFLSQIFAKVEGVVLNGHPTEVLPNTVNLSFTGIPPADKLILAMPELAVSSGSACSSDRPEPSYVISALNKGPESVASAIRFSFGRSTSEEDIDRAVEIVSKAVTQLKEAGQHRT